MRVILHPHHSPQDSFQPSCTWGGQGSDLGRLVKDTLCLHSLVLAFNCLILGGELLEVRLGFELFFFIFIIFLLVLGIVLLRFGVRTLFGKVTTFTTIEALKLFLG
jgi:hypothetical protein